MLIDAIYNYAELTALEEVIYLECLVTYSFVFTSKIIKFFSFNFEIMKVFSEVVYHAMSFKALLGLCQSLP